MAQIDSSNRFGVRVAGDRKDKVRLMRFMAEGWPTPMASAPLSRQDALNLAAWLVAVADAQADEFEELLIRVRSDAP